MDLPQHGLGSCVSICFYSQKRPTFQTGLCLHCETDDCVRKTAKDTMKTYLSISLVTFLFGCSMFTPRSDDGDPTAPRGTLVLIDKGGAEIDAVFQPICAGDHYDTCKDSEDVKTYPCVLIQELEGEKVWLTYDMKTGRPDTCYPKKKVIQRRYTNASCEGTPLGTDEQTIANFKNIPPVRVDDELYATDIEVPPVVLDSGFGWNADKTECSPIEFPLSKNFPFKPLPDSLVKLMWKYPYKFAEK